MEQLNYDFTISNVTSQWGTFDDGNNKEPVYYVDSPSVMKLAQHTFAIFRAYEASLVDGRFTIHWDKRYEVAQDVKIYLTDDNGEQVEKQVKASELSKYEKPGEPLFAYHPEMSTITLNKPGVYYIQYFIDMSVDWYNGYGAYVIVQDPKSPNYVKPKINIQSQTAFPTSSKVMVNGEMKTFDAYQINGNNYFKLRDIAKVLSGTSSQFDVEWNSEKQMINLQNGISYTPVGGEMSTGDGKPKASVLSTDRITRDMYLINLTAYKIKGNNYFKLRDLGKAFDFEVGWDSTKNTISIDTGWRWSE